MAKEVIWIGSQPTHCQLCDQALKDYFIDGRIRTGQWAIMCPECHELDGYGLGTGKGQEYKKQIDDRWKKING